MDDRMNVLDIGIDHCSAKEAFRKTIEYLDSAPVNLVETVTVEGFMQMEEFPQLKEQIRTFDLVMAGDSTVLEAAGVTERKLYKETEERVYLRMVLQYLHKHHKRLYLLAESEEEGRKLYQFIQKHYRGLQIVGLAKISAQNRADDMLVNDMNAEETDCIIAALTSPLQEDFILRNKNLLDTRLWLGISKSSLPGQKRGILTDRIGLFLAKHLFRKEIEKRKKICD